MDTESLGQSLGRNFRFALYCLFISAACIARVVRLFSVSGHSTSRNCRVPAPTIERCCVFLPFPARAAFSLLQLVCSSPSVFCYVLTPTPDPRQFSEKFVLHECMLGFKVRGCLNSSRGFGRRFSEFFGEMFFDRLLFAENTTVPNSFSSLNIVLFNFSLRQLGHCGGKRHAPSKN